MVGITRLSAADQTSAPGDEFDMLPVTNPPWLRWAKMLSSIVNER